MQIDISNTILKFILFIIIAGILSSIESALISLKDDEIDSYKKTTLNYKAINKLLSSPNLFLISTNFIVNLIFILFSTNILYSIFIAIEIKSFIIKYIVYISITILYVFISLLFAIYIPKRIGNKHNKTITNLFSPFMLIIFYILYPINIALNFCSEKIAKVLKITQNQERAATEEEIRMMMSLGAEVGTIQSEEKAMIENIFEFNNINAEDVMTHRTDTIAINIDASDEEILSTIKSTGFSRFPVYENEIGNIIGILSARKFFLNIHSDTKKTLRELLYTPYIAPTSIKADALFRKMQQQKVHLAIVVDEYGGFNGIVTLEDLLEEIVGNIYDENDKLEDVEILQIKKNLWKVKGNVEIETINSTLGTTIPLADDYDTLNGWIFYHLTFIPEDGSKFEITIDNINIKVLSIEDHRVERALISKINQ